MVINLPSHTIVKKSRFVDREFREVFSRKKSTVFFCLGNAVFRIEDNVQCGVLFFIFAGSESTVQIRLQFVAYAFISDGSVRLKKTNSIGTGGT